MFSWYDIAYWGFKELNRRKIADNVLCDKACDIAKNLTYDGYQSHLLQWSISFFLKGISDGTVKNEIISNKELAQKLH